MGKTDFLNHLSVNGLKHTKHRMEILDLLEKSSQPISAEEIFQEMKKNKILINMSTIYRTLDILEDKKILNKINISDSNKALYEYNSMLHTHHLICLGCKKILTISGCPLEGYEDVLAGETNYTIVGHKLDIYGYCPECLVKNRQEK